MKYITSLCLAFLLVGQMSAQIGLNTEVLSNTTYPDRHSDIWGFVDENGREYAILGVYNGTAVIDVTDPRNPVELAFIEGANSIWRDMKHWGDYVWVVADQGRDGILAINMSDAPDNITWEFFTPELTVNDQTATLEKCHNIYIDENGFAYLAGCNLNNGGSVILDVHTTPGTPIYAGASDPIYSHDVFARGDTLWGSDIYLGALSVTDVSDKMNPVRLAEQITPFEFTHNAWVSDDNNYAFTTDERANAYLTAYDVSDIGNIRETDRFRPLETEGENVIVHNTHYFNGFLVTSWYTDGVVIVDGSRPENLVEVANYDTWDGPSGDFNGCWGAYPWLPSGNLLVSDIQSGLYVIGVDYKRACWLEGTVRNSETDQVIPNVNVNIQSAKLNRENTDLDGEYKTGQVEAGTFTVEFTHPEFLSGEFEVVLENGKVTILDVELTPKAKISISGRVRDAFSQEMIPGANVRVSNSEVGFDVVADQNGEFQMEVFEEDYEVFAGAWGYHYYNLEDYAFTANEILIIDLARGYKDDFVLDYNWTASGDAGTGMWERGIPIETRTRNFIANPGSDVDFDLGEECYVTGNAGGNGGADDVDNGTVILTSDVMDLTWYKEPILIYSYWFVITSGLTPEDDTLKAFITNGVDTVQILAEAEAADVWKRSDSIRVADIIEITDQMQVIYQTTDFEGFGHIVEAGIDAFEIIEGQPVNTDNFNEIAFSMYPNPAYDQVTLEAEDQLEYVITDLQGRIVSGGSLSGNSNTINLEQTLAPAPYIVRLVTENGTAEKVLVKR